MQQRIQATFAMLIVLTFGWASAQDFAGSYKETVYGIVITIAHDGNWYGQLESGGATFPIDLELIDNELTGTWSIDDEVVGFSATLNDDGDLDFQLFEFRSPGEPAPETYEHYLAERVAPEPRRSLGGALARRASTPPSEPETPSTASPELALEDPLVIDGVWETEDDLFNVGVPARITYTFASGQFELDVALMDEDLLWYRGVYQLEAEPGATEGIIAMEITEYSPEMCFQGDCEPVHLSAVERHAVSLVELLTPDSLRITEEDGAMVFTRSGDAPTPKSPAAPTVPAAPGSPPPPPSAPPAPKLP